MNYGKEYLTSLTAFSSSRAEDMASHALSHSCFSGAVMAVKTIRPPLLFRYSMSVVACPLSSSEHCLKYLESPGRAMSSRSK